MRVSVQVSRLRYWPSLESPGESRALSEGVGIAIDHNDGWRPRRCWFGVGTCRGESRRGRKGEWKRKRRDREYSFKCGPILRFCGFALFAQLQPKFKLSDNIRKQNKCFHLLDLSRSLNRKILFSSLLSLEVSLKVLRNWFMQINLINLVGLLKRVIILKKDYIVEYCLAYWLAILIYDQSQFLINLRISIYINYLYYIFVCTQFSILRDWLQKIYYRNINVNL